MINKITDSLDKLPAIHKKDLERNLCTCNEVPKIAIIKAIANGAKTLDEIKEQTYASDGIGCCSRKIEQLINYIHFPDRVDNETLNTSPNKRVANERLQRLEKQLKGNNRPNQHVLNQWIRRYGDDAKVIIDKYTE